MGTATQIAFLFFEHFGAAKDVEVLQYKMANRSKQPSKLRYNNKKITKIRKTESLTLAYQRHSCQRFL